MDKLKLYSCYILTSERKCIRWVNLSFTLVIPVKLEMECTNIIGWFKFYSFFFEHYQAYITFQSLNNKAWPSLHILALLVVSQVNSIMQMYMQTYLWGGTKTPWVISFPTVCSHKFLLNTRLSQLYCWWISCHILLMKMQS